MPLHLAIIDSHPVQYKAPMYRILAKFDIKITVYYCERFGNDDYVDPDFRVAIKWDTDLLSGYDHVFLKNRAWRPSPYSPIGEINPGIWPVIHRGQFDAVLINGYSRASDLIALFSARMFRTPVIFKGEADNLGPIGRVKSALKRAIVPRILSQPKAVLYSCSANKDYFRSYGVAEHKLVSCPSAVDNQHFQSEYQNLIGSRQGMRAGRGIPNNASVILYTGRLTNRKRPLDLLRARLLLDSKSPVWTIFVGDGPERVSVEEFARINNIDNVIVTGFVNQSQISNYYVIADVFALSSQHDPSPKSLHEAMNFRLPVVVSDKLGTARDLVRNGENGFVYEFGNVEELASSLAKCLESDETRQMMGQRSLELVSDWTFEAQAQGILDAVELATSVNTPT